MTTPAAYAARRCRPTRAARGVQVLQRRRAAQDAVRARSARLPIALQRALGSRARAERGGRALDAKAEAKSGGGGGAARAVLLRPARRAARDHPAHARPRARPAASPGSISRREGRTRRSFRRRLAAHALAASSTGTADSSCERHPPARLYSTFHPAPPLRHPHSPRPPLQHKTRPPHPRVTAPRSHPHARPHHRRHFHAVGSSTRGSRRVSQTGHRPVPQRHEPESHLARPVTRPAPVIFGRRPCGVCRRLFKAARSTDRFVGTGSYPKRPRRADGTPTAGVAAARLERTARTSGDATGRGRARERTPRETASRLCDGARRP